jgi:transcriptional regulator with XRE-family HTH domain
MPAAPHPAGRQPREGTRLPSQVVADNVRALREQRRHSQAFLAGLVREQGLDWKQSTVSQVELGARHVNVDELLALAAALAVSPADLLSPFTAMTAALVINGRRSLADHRFDEVAVDLGMGHVQSGKFVDDWVRDNLGKMVLKHIDGKPELLKERTVYEAGWHERLDETGPNQVRMRHPDLEQEVTVFASAVPHHQQAGWYEVVEAQEDVGDEQPQP